MHSCPACQREFENILDFPAVYISAVKELPLPPFLGTDGKGVPTKVSRRRGLFGTEWIDNPEIPAEVHEAFRQGNKEIVPIGGLLYDYDNGSKNLDGIAHEYWVCWVEKDALNEVQEKLRKPDVESTISFLESLIGKEVSRSELKRGLRLNYNNGIFLGSHEESEGGRRIATLDTGYGTMSRSEGRYDWIYSLPVAKIEYQGRVKLGEVFHATPVSSSGLENTSPQ